MTNDNNQTPAPIDPAPPDVEAEPVGTALEVRDSPPVEPPPPEAAGRSPGLILLAIFAAVLAIASAAYFSRSRAPAAQAAGPEAQAPTPVTIKLPAATAPEAGGAHDAPGPANPSPDKIFNDASSFKENLSEAAPAAADGYINELPPAPHATPDGGGNNALRDAAKRALQDDDGDSQPAENPEASLAPYDARALAALESDARAALAFSSLAAKARSGDPYTDELTAFLAEPQDKPLPAFIADRAADGVPTAAALAARFPDRHRAALAAGRRAEASNIGARATASLASLVNLRPAGAIRGETTAAILSRVEAATTAGDLESALAEAAKLRPEAAAALAPWTGDAKARVALEAALAEREQSLHARLAGGRL
jgi:hypothetical protein